MTIRILSHEPDCQVIPQAIIWRPLRYFTLQTRHSEDELDSYEGASFAIGNDIRFDLRHYAGHPALTVSIYLPLDIDDQKRIAEILDIIIQEMRVPPTAVAWRRGQDFQYGKLDRPSGDRLLEPEARNLVLKIAVQQPGLQASTNLLKKEMPLYTELSAKDRVKSTTRPNEEIWQQIVGNVRAHHNSRVGPFVKGYAQLIPKGISVTRKGAIYLMSMGFLSSSDFDFDE